MGWTNSPGFFSKTTESGVIITYNLLKSPKKWRALPPHPLEHKFLPAVLPERPLPSREDLLFFLIRVYIDDYIKAAAVSKGSIHLLVWLTRAVLHAIHSLFPPPEVTGHEGGKDSISQKKLDLFEGIWNYIKEILGFELNGEARTITIPEEKAESYSELIASSLQKQTIKEATLREIGGKMQHVGIICPTIRGFLCL